MPTLGWGSEIPKKEESKPTRILLVERDPDSLSDAERAKIAQCFGAFEAVRIDPVDREDYLRICQENGNPPVVHFPATD